MICVTRYFGGTLLGTGGLRRAYTDSGRLALEAGEPVTLIPALKWRRNCSYPVFEMLSRKASSSGWTVENIEYGQDVAFDILVPEEAENDIKRYCLDLTGGTLVLEDPDKLLMKGPKVPLS
jgi:putative IMPACT (imprinted ancient) family translation regulator